MARIALLVALQAGQIPMPDPGETYRREIAERRAAEYRVAQFKDRWGGMVADMATFIDETQAFATELNAKGTWNLPQLLKADEAKGKFDKSWDHLKKAEGWPK